MKKILLSIVAVITSGVFVFGSMPPSGGNPPAGGNPPGGGSTTINKGTFDDPSKPFEPFDPTTPVIPNPVTPPRIAPASTPVVFTNPITGELVCGNILVMRNQYFQIQFPSTRYISQIEVTDMITGTTYSYNFNCFVDTVDVSHPIGVGRWKISVITRLMGTKEVIETEILINSNGTGYVIPIN